MKLSEKLEQILSKVQKPGRYVGGELNAVRKDPSRVKTRFAFCFPDTYEIGMSHLGMKILYGLMNQREDVWCERVFAPWVDMEELMRKEGLPLYGLESGDPISQFDFVGFTLQYEMSYTNVLNMLDLGGIPVRNDQRREDDPIVIAGGPCVCNPEPLADFIDLFCLGAGEEVDLEVIDLYQACKEAGKSRREFLREAAQIPGVYVPTRPIIPKTLWCPFWILSTTGPWRRCSGAASGAAGSARLGLFTALSLRNPWRPSAASAGICAPPPAMTKSPSPP